MNLVSRSLLLCILFQLTSSQEKASTTSLDDHPFLHAIKYVHRRALENLGLDLKTIEEENKRRLQLFPQEGLSFERAIQVSDGQTLKVLFDDEKCDALDDSGHNKCRYDWGDNINV